MQTTRLFRRRNFNNHATIINPAVQRYVNQNCKFFGTKEDEDRRLSKEFYDGDGKLNFIQYWQSMESKEQDKFIQLTGKLMSKGIIALIPLPDLYNPLLQKYSFNTEEFALGVKNFAFPSINDNIAFLEHVSANPSRFSDDSNLPIIAEKKAALKEQLQSKEYSFTLFRIRTLKETRIFQHRTPDAVLQFISIESVRTRIAGDSSTLSFQIEGDLSPSDKEAASKFVTEVQEKLVQSDVKRYGHGSVVATVKCSLWTVGKDAKLRDTSTLRTELWTMEGCISGQVPLEWTVNRILGPAKVDFWGKLLYRWLHWLHKYAKEHTP